MGTEVEAQACITMAFYKAAANLLNVKVVGNFFRRSVEKRLRVYGLRFEDIIENEDPIVQAAVGRMTEEERLSRGARLRRALDISAKKTALPADVQAAHNPY